MKKSQLSTNTESTRPTGIDYPLRYELQEIGQSARRSLHFKVKPFFFKHGPNPVTRWMVKVIKS
jgi:hypothetical protein